ncbi:MAG: hypothetical protein IT353_05825 [Gemmatimonadaceae bacterium]|nr:hypothetical protein [Gemmatimonadaceae bacterium]
MRTVYAALTSAAQAAASVVPNGSHKFVRSLRARRGLTDRFVQRAQLVRDPRRPLVWMHAPSVGEGLQARPVMHALRAAHPTWQLAYTFFSPSAEPFASTVGADVTDYLPFDRVVDAERLLDALRPQALVFAKLDVWPVLVERAHARGIPVALISGTLSEQSSRRGWWSQQVVRDAYAALSAVGAIDSAHAQRLQSLGVRAAALRITGDTRFDQVAARASAVDRTSPLLTALMSRRPTLVAGSTWPADERVLCAAWDANRSRHHGAATEYPRLIIAPHEPTDAHCEPLRAWAARTGLSLAMLSGIVDGTDTRDVDVVLVDRVGVLGDLYALAEIAFVGGGFHSAGLHSVIEPAAFGTPVLFGPRHHASREASLLLAAGAAKVAHDAGELSTYLSAWFTDQGARTVAGTAARHIVSNEVGATVRSVALIESLISEQTQ